MYRKVLELYEASTSVVFIACAAADAGKAV